MVRLGLAELLYRKGLPLQKAYALLEGDTEGLDEAERQKAREVLLSAKILDPAVGSGPSGGVLQVIEETLDLLGEPRTLERKKRLLQNLYGVDALSWAVWMAELRLWLSYFIELPDSSLHSQEPLLPSLGLHIVQGDSVVQRIGNRAVPTRLELSRQVRQDPQVRQALSALLDAKEGISTTGELAGKSVRQREEAFLLAVLDAQYGKGEQGLLVKGEPEEYDEERRFLEQAIRSQDRPFLYLLDFAEVVVGDGGFDLVIGNPLLMCGKRLSWTPFAALDEATYKAYLQDEARRDLARFPGFRHGALPNISGRSDLYVYFYVRTLALLKETGVQVFITSNSWLDVQYGAWLQKVFLHSALALRDREPRRAHLSGRHQRGD